MTMTTLGFFLLLLSPAEDEGSDAPITAEELKPAAAVAAIDLTDAEVAQMLPKVIEQLKGYQKMRGFSLDNTVPPAFTFAPLPPDPSVPRRKLIAEAIALPDVERPADLRELLWADIGTLASLVRSQKVSCVELAALFIARLHEVDPVLHCVISYTEERALAQAQTLDDEIASGKWRGPLHGIPYGAKDLLAVKGTVTSWGANPYREQKIDADATIITKLDAAGAVLVAKLTLGALAMGDVWYGGKTRSPWNPERGSSGSSAGSAATVGAGALPFAIGSETLGSIVSPSRRCGNTSLRPTFGRVSRAGAMALSWSMDKLGPLCRSADDAALVFSAIHGADGIDLDAVDRPFIVPPVVDISGWKIGYLADSFEKSPEHRSVIKELESLGAEMVELTLPDYPVSPMMVILFAESACAFDELTRSGEDDELVQQGPQAWPNSFRAARMIPAVEYIRAQRLRTLLMRDMAKSLAALDAYICPAGNFPSLATTNLTGHPAVVAPCGVRENGMPRSITFVGHPYDETRLLAIVSAWQKSTEHHHKRPPEVTAGE